LQNIFFDETYIQSSCPVFIILAAQFVIVTKLEAHQGGLVGGSEGAPPDDMRGLGVLPQENYEEEICLLSHLSIKKLYI
jgi:hypothetical protein